MIQTDNKVFASGDALRALSNENKALKAENERLKDRVERLELLLFKIQETSTPHIGSIALYQAEMKAINRWCKLALGKGNNPDTKKGGEDE